MLSLSRSPFRYLTSLVVLCCPIARQWSAVVGGTAPIPFVDNLIANFDPADAGTVNGAIVTNWADRVSGIAAVGITSKEPTFVASGVGGKPCVLFTAPDYMHCQGMIISSPGAMKTAVDSKNYTMVAAFRVPSGATMPTDPGHIFGPVFSGTAVLQVGPDFAGMHNTYAPYTARTFDTLGMASTSDVFEDGGNISHTKIYISGSAVCAKQSETTSGQNEFAIGAWNSSAAFGVNAEIYGILVYDRQLTPAEYMEAVKYLHDKCQQPYPWANADRFCVFDGDSITQGFGATDAEHTYPYLAAQSLGLSYGEWSNVGVASAGYLYMDPHGAGSVDNIAAVTGKPLTLCAFEWANNRYAPPTVPTAYTMAMAYCANRKAANASIKIVFGTTPDTSSDFADGEANRHAFCDALVASHSNVDALVSLHTIADLGPDGSYTSALFSDGVHLSNAGYVVLADAFVAGINALP